MVKPITNNKTDKVYRDIKLKKIEGEDLKCPSCKIGYLKQHFSDYTCRWCGSRYKEIK